MPASSRLAGMLLWLGLCLPGLLWAQPAAETTDAPVRVAYVDMQRLLDNAPQTVAARQRLEAEFATRDQALKIQEGRLQGLQQALRDEAGLLGSDERARRSQEIETLSRSLERTRNRMSEELSRRTREESDRVWPLVNEAVARYARSEGIDLVVPSPVVYASARVDITERVLDQMRQTPQEP